MPSGTMANQLAIAVLSGTKSKVFVQETSHVFRDEADAAQSVNLDALLINADPFMKDNSPKVVDKSELNIEAKADGADETIPF